MSGDDRIEWLRQIIEPVLSRHGESAMVVQAAHKELLDDLATTVAGALADVLREAAEHAYKLEQLLLNQASELDGGP